MTKIGKAIKFAVDAHGDTTRKGKNRLYILHPIEAMTIVASLTETEDVLAAAVLHDVVEDAGVTKEELHDAFGETVADLVMAESEDKMRDIPSEASWKARKQATIDHLAGLKRDALLICLGDKLANMREISRDYKELYDKLWERFNQKDKEAHRWYYSSIFKILAKTFGEVPPIQEYRALLKEVFGWEEGVNG